MKLPRRRFLRIAAAAAALPGAARVESADVYPGRPVSVIVPVPAGGQMDSIARIITERMRTRLGQPIIIENVTGASGTLGVGRVARATADGYTLLYGAWATQVVNGAVYDLPYDVVKDFEPIALTSITPWLIAAKHAVPSNGLREFITWLYWSRRRERGCCPHPILYLPRHISRPARPRPSGGESRARTLTQRALPGPATP